MEKIERNMKRERNVSHTMHDSELIRRYTLNVMFVTELIKDSLTSPTQNAKMPQQPENGRNQVKSSSS